MIFLGCDGGSTKTELLLTDESGQMLAHRVFGGCNLAYLGEDGLQKHLQTCVQAVLDDAGKMAADVTGAMFGIPLYGEVAGTEEFMPRMVRELLPDCRVIEVENDAVAGWGGSLGGKTGIHVVAGTGTITYAQDEAHHACRVGGWSLMFADEGSCSWVGRQVIAAFVKQADGRLPRTVLYDLVREHFNLTENDLYFAQTLQIDFRQDSSKVAALQRIALQAAQSGDETMKQVYRAAADELTQMVAAAKNKLSFAASPAVSYAGGLFHAGDLVLKPFYEGVEALGCHIVKPRFSPVVGAVALAARQLVDASVLDTMLERLEAARPQR